MILAHRIALDPTNRQETYFARAAGTARFAWNWALAEWQRQYQAGAKPNEMELRKRLNATKDEQFPWMAEVTKNAPQQAIKNLGAAFGNFFEGRAKFPTFKKKGIHDSFRGARSRFPGHRLKPVSSGSSPRWGLRHGRLPGLSRIALGSSYARCTR